MGLVRDVREVRAKAMKILLVAGRTIRLSRRVAYAEHEATALFWLVPVLVPEEPMSEDSH